MLEVSLRLPAWVKEVLETSEKSFPTDEDRMRFVLALTERNVVEKTGGPFGAAVFEKESGRLVSVGVNVVVSARCGAAHAEMMALALAQQARGTHDLGSSDLPSHQLVTSGKMCAMCLGGVCWSGVKEVISSARPSDVESITGFDEGPTPPDYDDQLTRRGIRVVNDVLRDEGRAVLQRYVENGGVIYNASRG